MIANATSTVALWPGAVGSMLGYLRELRGTRTWALGFALPSLAGGLVGALLLLVTPADRFDAIVPWLVIGATALFVLQRPLMRGLQRQDAVASEGGAPRGDPTLAPPSPSVLIFQFFIAIYGGYFGAGIGILMLAALGFMGLTNIHRMNGLKNWGGLCTNLVAAITFSVSHLVDWRVALAMAVGAIAGGYGGSRLAQSVPQAWVRRSVAAIGFASGLWLLFLRQGTRM